MSVREAKMTEFQNEFEKLNAQQSTIREKIENVSKRQDAFEKAHDPHKKEHDETRANIKKIQDEIEPLIQQRNAARARKVELSSKVKNIKDKTPGRSKEEILDKIDKLEYQIETSTLNNQQLRSKLSEIDSLKKSLGSFGNLGSIEHDVKVSAQSERELNEKIKVLIDQKNKLYQAMAAFNQDNKETKEQRDKLWQERKGYYTQLNEIKGKMDEIAKARKEYNDQFFANRNQLYQKKNELAVLMHDRLQIYQDAERHMNLLEKGAKQAGEIKERRNPNEDKINSARSLIGYLQTILSFDQEKDEQEEVKIQGKKEDNSALSLIGSVRKQTKKEKKAAKKEKKQEEKAKTSKLDLTFESIQQLAQLDLTPPTTTEQIPAIIAELKKKAQQWEDEFVKLVLKFDIQPDGSIKSAISFA